MSQDTGIADHIWNATKDTEPGTEPCHAEQTAPAHLSWSSPSLQITTHKLGAEAPQAWDMESRAEAPEPQYSVFWGWLWTSKSCLLSPSCSFVYAAARVGLALTVLHPPVETGTPISLLPLVPVSHICKMEAVPTSQVVSRVKCKSGQKPCYILVHAIILSNRHKSCTLGAADHPPGISVRLKYPEGLSGSQLLPWGP